jgi:glycosyltransferase involved in cell wall biosynthesis
MKSTICLVMIVKNESHIIGETLKCLIEKAPFQYWVICDTGSTDGTQDIIKETLKDIPGELHEVPWVDFGTNRTQVVELAYGKTDYALMFDADDTIEGVINFPEEMTADICNLLFRIGCIEFHRSSIFSNRRRWKYMGVLHEYLESTDGLPVVQTTITEGNYKCVARTEGARSKDPDRFRKDALTLGAAFEATKDPIRTRYAFYCANSWKDCGNCENAIMWYKRTLELDGWTQEKYIACLRIYEMYAKLGTPELGLYALVESVRYDRDRAECMHLLVNHYLLKGMNDVAFKYFELLNPDFDSVDRSTKLFVHPEPHTFLLPYTMIILSDRTNRRDIGLKMYEVILRHKHRPNPWYLPHLFGNTKFFPGVERYAEELQEYARENGYSWTGA